MYTSVLLGTVYRFSSSICVLGEDYVFMINMLVTNDMYLSFCIFLYIWCGFIPTAVWGFSNIYFPTVSGVGRLL